MVSASEQLCFVPNEGRSVRFTHPQNWVPGGVPQVPGEHARAEDLARWWGVGPAGHGGC
ncbi:hypothetical protein [Streptomyces sp. NPDC059743]|uniref:hypothetical protein n=1 Tax=Streptomyces sp. NPDC059743 TaxID=3346928 RepID=UPI0036633ED2